MGVALKRKRLLTIRRSETENSTILIYPQLRIRFKPPIYAAKLHAFDQPFLELYPYPAADNVLVGDARSSSSTSEIRLTMSGKEYTLTTDANNNSFGLEGYDEGKLRWVENSKPKNRVLELVDHTGRLLARLKARRSNVERRTLELYVECTESLLALVLLSGFV
ncbi:hypothetical protein J3F84DRAFT_404180 [Trichoderma pleuroticola]